MSNSDKSILVTKLNGLASEYPSQGDVAKALTSETGATFTQSNVSRMLSGKETSTKTLSLVIYVLEQLAIKNAHEYQYTIV
ncbi:hypothetical protein [Vibrio marisflavi]|uniref:Uncharacterized protein n=1 Tax=Vibrio marisflavi CECT 7928 TaxID=634439 RepID=A0ABN8ECA5_9VIBR|nr:hypothetical protein [Vibrio marisflavi]CAH0542993.1 hypothetical protein VMF7928_04350 [Vibrio marisflavi CECT 7928]